MAIYHMSSQIIGRSDGKSVVASAAYRSAEKLENSRTGEEHDYTPKRGVGHKIILAPEGSPSWVYDRSQLWNNVEQIEKRKDAQLAREINVAIPVELAKGEGRELVEKYAQKNFVQSGMVADICFHNEGGENPHAHIMLTMRSIDQNGFGKKNREWNDKQNLENWREGWATSCNLFLERSGHQGDLDHRSFQRQGLGLLPTVHLGVSAHAMEQKGIETERGDYNREIKKINELRKNIKAIEQEKPKKNLSHDELIKEYKELGKPRYIGTEKEFIGYYLNALTFDVKLFRQQELEEAKKSIEWSKKRLDDFENNEQSRGFLSKLMNKADIEKKRSELELDVKFRKQVYASALKEHEQNKEKCEKQQQAQERQALREREAQERQQKALETRPEMKAAVQQEIEIRAEIKRQFEEKRAKEQERRRSRSR